MNIGQRGRKAADPVYGSYNCITCDKSFDSDQKNLLHLLQDH